MKLFSREKFGTVIKCALCPDKRFKWNGGVLTNHANKHIREGKAVRVTPWGRTAEESYDVVAAATQGEPGATPEGT